MIQMSLKIILIRQHTEWQTIVMVHFLDGSLMIERFFHPDSEVIGPVNGLLQGDS